MDWIQSRHVWTCVAALMGWRSVAAPYTMDGVYRKKRNKSTYNRTTSHRLNVGRGIVNVVPRLATTAVRGVAQTKPVAHFVDQGHTQGSLLIFPN